MACHFNKRKCSNCSNLAFLTGKFRPDEPWFFTSDVQDDKSSFFIRFRPTDDKIDRFRFEFGYLGMFKLQYNFDMFCMIGTFVKESKHANESLLERNDSQTW